MNGRNKRRNKQETYQAVYEAVMQAQIFGSKKATSHFVARWAHITPAYANRVLADLWKTGQLACRTERYKNTFRRVWVTPAYAKRHAEYILSSDVPTQMELPL